MSATTWLGLAQHLHAEGQPYAMVTVMRALAPTSAKAGDKALVTEDGQIHGWVGGGCAQPAVVKTARRALRDGQLRQIRITPREDGGEQMIEHISEFGMACPSGGTLEMLIEPVLPPTPLMVVGQSPVAQALVQLAAQLDFAVTLVSWGAQPQDWPSARRVIASDEAEQVRPHWRGDGLVVVATQGRRDLYGLQLALALPTQGCWFIASRRKTQALQQELLAAGADAAAVQAIVAPAGVDIGARTPSEIALSVLASLIAHRRGHALAHSSHSSQQE